MYLNSEMGLRGLISCEGCMKMEEKGFGWCVRNSVEPLVEGVKAAETTEFEGIQKELDEGKERTMEKKDSL